MCECHQIDGRFIAEDPDCPVHGRDAQAREEEMEQLRAAAFDPTKLSISIKHHRDYGGVNDIVVTLSYDGKEISKDSMTLPRVESYPSGWDD